MFDPFYLGLFHMNGFGWLLFIAGKHHANIINLLVYLENRSAYELEIVPDQNPIDAAKANIDQVDNTLDFFQFELHLGPGQRFNTKIPATLQALHVFGKGDFKALIVEGASPGVEDILQLVGSIEIEAQMPQVIGGGGLFEIVGWVDEKVVAVCIIDNPGDTGETVETGPDHIHRDDDLFINQLIEQIGEFLTLDFACFTHNPKPLNPIPILNP